MGQVRCHIRQLLDNWQQPLESWPDSRGERCVRRKRAQKPREGPIGQRPPGKAVQELGGGWTSVCSLNTDSLSSAVGH